MMFWRMQGKMSERNKAMFICQMMPQRVSTQDSERWIFLNTTKGIFVLPISTNSYTQQNVWKAEAMDHPPWMIIFCFMTVQLFTFLHSIWQLSYLPFSSILDRVLSSPDSSVYGFKEQSFLRFLRVSFHHLRSSKFLLFWNGQWWTCEFSTIHNIIHF